MGSNSGIFISATLPDGGKFMNLLYKKKILCFNTIALRKAKTLWM